MDANANQPPDHAAEMVDSIRRQILDPRQQVDPEGSSIRIFHRSDGRRLAVPIHAHLADDPEKRAQALDRSLEELRPYIETFVTEGDPNPDPPLDPHAFRG